MRPQKKNSSSTFSCRMRKDLYASLLNESEKKAISFNSLINGIAKKYDSFDKFGDEIGFMPLSNIALTQIFDLLDEKNITSIARYVGETIPKEMAMMSHIGDDYERLFDLVEVIANKFGTVSILKKNGDFSFTIRHKVNKNFSLYISEFFLAMGKSFKLEVNVDLVEKNIVIVNLENKLYDYRNIKSLKLR
mgnify:FL=1